MFCIKLKQIDDDLFKSEDHIDFFNGLKLGLEDIKHFSIKAFSTFYWRVAFLWIVGYNKGDDKIKIKYW